jgi:hypothetical protein
LTCPGSRTRTSLADFDCYVEEHRIPDEDYPAAFALWLAEVTGGRRRDSKGLSARHRRAGS